LVRHCSRMNERQQFVRRAAMAFESSASASSATPAFRAGQKLRRSSRACKPRGGPSTSRRITACRTLARLRSNVFNGWRGVTREGAVARGIGTGGKMIGCGGATVMDGATSTAAGSKEVGVGGGGPRSLGVETRGGNGCTQLRFALGLCAGGATGVTTRRGRTGGGGRVPGGAPSASRKRRIRSSSLCGGGRGGVPSLGEGGSGFSASPEAFLVSHLKISASPARTRKMSVSFIAAMSSAPHCQAPSVDGFSVAPIDSRIVVSACTFFIRT
jgi:hypothetical protein